MSKLGSLHRSNQLADSTRAILKAHRQAEPFFSNMIAAELFEAANTRGRFTVLPTTDGHYVVHERERPNGQSCRGRFKTLADALEKLTELAAKEQPPHG